MIHTTPARSASCLKDPSGRDFDHRRSAACTQLSRLCFMACCLFCGLSAVKLLVFDTSAPHPISTRLLVLIAFVYGMGLPWGWQKLGRLIHTHISSDAINKSSARWFLAYGSRLLLSIFCGWMILLWDLSMRWETRIVSPPKHNSYALQIGSSSLSAGQLAYRFVISLVIFSMFVYRHSA